MNNEIKYSSSNKLIIKNTLMLYIRQIIILFVSLYTSRIILKSLGIIDYGVYNVVAGVVTLFAFFSSAMTTVCQRFFSFEIGRNNYLQLKRVFNTSILIYALIAGLIFIFSEIIGLWILKTKLIIPTERIYAAQFVFHFSLFSFIFTIVSTPFIALIMAHECMSIFAKISLLEAFLKLITAYCLFFFQWINLYFIVF